MRGFNNFLIDNLDIKHLFKTCLHKSSDAAVVNTACLAYVSASFLSILKSVSTLKFKLCVILEHAFYSMHLGLPGRTTHVIHH